MVNGSIGNNNMMLNISSGTCVRFICPSNEHGTNDYINIVIMFLLLVILLIFRTFIFSDIIII